ncbi:MAG: hypothetical protein D3925_18675 [Candidatus Electrothrix sp. AR5]|nr:hypothetical protein [Candidatus Electrothrix sp. AR5]
MCGHHGFQKRILLRINRLQFQQYTENFSEKQLLYRRHWSILLCYAGRRCLKKSNGTETGCFARNAELTIRKKTEPVVAAAGISLSFVQMLTTA